MQATTNEPESGGGYSGEGGPLPLVELLEMGTMAESAERETINCESLMETKPIKQEKIKNKNKNEGS